MQAHFVGDVPLGGIILATPGSDNWVGPLPELVEDEREKVLREWLESKGSIALPYPYRFLTLFTGVRPEEYELKVLFDGDGISYDDADGSDHDDDGFGDDGSSGDDDGDSGFGDGD